MPVIHGKGIRIDCADRIDNIYETSTGQLYDIETLGRIARKFGLLYIVDAISTICADPFSMDDWHVNFLLESTCDNRSISTKHTKRLIRERHLLCIGNGFRAQLPFGIHAPGPEELSGQLSVVKTVKVART